MAAEPIRVGMSMALTGGVAPIGKQVLAALQIWRDDVNAKGGLLGRPVELVFYDDQSNPANVPQIYTKLIEVDKVDLLIGPYATNMVAPAIPVLMQIKKTTIGILANAANSKFHYDQYFSMLPTGPEPQKAFSRGSSSLQPALSRARRRSRSSRPMPNSPRMPPTARAQSIKEMGGFEIVSDRNYPPATTDFTPIMRAVQALNPDIVYVAAYPPDSVGIVRAANEIGLTPKMFGGTLIGLLVTPIKMQLGPLMNGIINNEVFLPAPAFTFPRHARAAGEVSGDRQACRESIRSDGPFRHSAMRRAKCWRRRSKAPRASTTRRSPTTSAAMHSAPWSATSPSARMANGQSRASSSRSSRTSLATRSTNSRTRPTRSSIWPKRVQVRRHDLPVRQGENPWIHMNGTPFKLATFAKPGRTRPSSPSCWATMPSICRRRTRPIALRRGGSLERHRQHPRPAGELGGQFPCCRKSWPFSRRKG